MALDATAQPAKLRSVTTENRIARFTLIILSLVFLLLILLLPLAAVFV
ncbi:sulfate/thiosulfate ABC transporter permease CysW, partial [Rhizobium ruizarguesonis]